jgi:predicted permease
VLGIGANTAIFQLLDAVRMRPLPVARPGELVEIDVAVRENLSGRFEGRHPSITEPVWAQLRAHGEPFDGLVAFCDESFNLAKSGEVRNARGLYVSGGFFDVLGVRPQLGRTLVPADDAPGALAVAVLGDAFWRREYGASPSVVGRTVSLEGHPFEIVGVAPPGFFGVEPGCTFDVAVPIASEAVINGEASRIGVRRSWWLAAMGRLRPGWSAERASEYLATVSPEIFEPTVAPEFDADTAKLFRASSLVATPAATGLSELREEYETSLWLLLAIAGVVLLIACANLANLLLARASVQEREMAVRLALGASRWRLVRQLLTESLLLAAAGAALGLVAASILSRALVAFLETSGNARFVDLGLDWRIFGFTAALAVSTCVLFGVAPALRATRTTASASLKSGARGSTDGRERLGLRRALVAAQVALSLMLVVGALLFARTLVNLVARDPGIRRSELALTTVDTTALDLPVERRAAFNRELVERVRSVPGVVAAADSAIIPLSGAGWNDEIWMEGSDHADRALTYFNSVGSGYFETMGIEMLAGRDFDDRDMPDSPKVTIVNEEFARRFTGGADPVGQRYLSLDDPSKPPVAYEIVGLVKDAKYRTLREKIQPTAFLASSQSAKPGQFQRILLRSAVSPAEILPAVRSALTSVDERLVFRSETIDDRVRDSILQERLMAALSGFFGLLALALATVGLYGVTTYMVARRTHEIGIRMALGAMRSTIAGMVMREVATLLVAGLVVGAVATFVATKSTSALLYGVAPNDPLAFLAAAAILTSVAVAAGLVPAYRASSVDPMRALRDE